jgi:hypothetical protein
VKWVEEKEEGEEEGKREGNKEEKGGRIKRRERIERIKIVCFFPSTLLLVKKFKTVCH